MGREIRVTVDDDEVFERMKARKHELDLSWREVLHRGLWAGPDGPGDGGGPRTPGGATGPGSKDEDLGDRIERQVKRRVERSLQSAFGTGSGDSGGRSGGIHVDIGGGAGVADLEEAEDAVLRFPFLDVDDDPQYRVPLRVNLRTTAEGLDVEVVAVRTGKSVRGTNAFDREARMGIARGFSRGERARLELGEGAEHYDVAVSLSWGRDDTGRPTVESVDVEEVVFDVER